MMDFFRDGGMSMWLLLATAIGTVAVAVARPRETRALTFGVGTIAILIEGMLGLSMGMRAVSQHFGRFPDPTQAIGIGLGELSNNGSFAAMLATGLGLAALLSHRSTPTV